MKIRLGDYLDKRYAAAVVIGIRKVPSVVVNEFARVLFKVDTVNADNLILAVYVDVYLSRKADGSRHLRDLIRFGKIGIEVVLSVPFCEPRDIAVHYISSFDDVLDRFLVEYGQSSGKSAADGAAAGVRRTAEFGGTGTENL